MIDYNLIFPKWSRELERYLPMRSLFYIYRNIYDYYLFPRKISRVKIPGIKSSDACGEFFIKNNEHYGFDGDSETVILRGFMTRSDRDYLKSLYPENPAARDAFDALYTISHDYHDVATMEDLRWLLLNNLNMYLYYFLVMQGYTVIAFYDVVDGFTFPFNSEDMKKEFSKLCQLQENSVDASKAERVQANNPAVRERNVENQLAKKIDDALNMIRRALRNDTVPVAVIFKYSSRILSTPSHLDPEENKSFIKIMKICEESALTFQDDIQRRNLMFLITEKLNDLPPWLYLENPQSNPLLIDRPDSHTRRQFFDIYRNDFHHSDRINDPEELEKIQNIFIDMTSAMSLIDLENIRSISITEKVEMKNMKNIIERYKYGIIESEWDKIDKSKLDNAEPLLRQRVKGQTEAVLHVLDIIKRAKAGLSGVQQSAASSRPRGVLFFAGPTGVGKTELAKAMAELLFGDEKKCIRFDMSEYGHEHSDQRLMGAPPGYVGYEEGGQLTNAVRQNPFCVLLFDEIEKAHPKIFDKFLQILDDGRMTDGKGETVYFSEAIIIFTSNLGTYIIDTKTGEVKQNTNPDMPFPEVKKKIKNAIDDYFNYNLRRPELLNRFGENFLVFDYIRKDTATLIIEKIIANFTNHLQQDKQITVMIEKKAIDQLSERSFANLQFGGRGIGNVFEKFLINPFARYFYDNQVSAGEILTVVSIDEDPQGSISLIIDRAN